MAKVGLYVPLEAKPGREAEVEAFLKGALPLAEAEPDTVVWFAIKLSPTTFAVFDAFPDDSGRQAHLSGDIAAALMAQAPDLFAVPPDIRQFDVLASKLPG